MLPMAAFSARVLADPDDQDQVTLEGPTLQRVPILRAGEMQLPTGEGEDPPSQPSIDGLEPDLPTITHAFKLRTLQGTALLPRKGWSGSRRLNGCRGARR